MSRNRRKRLETLEQKMADLMRPEALANCTCREYTCALLPKVFEAEMNRTCPVHGFRRLGRIFVTEIVHTGKDKITWDEEEKNCADKAELDRLLKEYNIRLAQAEQAEEEEEYDSGED